LLCLDYIQNKEISEMKKIGKLISIPAFLAMILGLPIAFAEEPVAPEYQEAAPGHAGQEIDAETKDKFIAAYSDVLKIQNKYAEKLQTVTDEESARKLQMEAQEEMLTAVESNGMTADEYNHVIQLVSTNPELKSEIDAQVQ
jgi:hypothetical protein